MKKIEFFYQSIGFCY